MDDSEPLGQLEIPWWRRWPWVAMLGSVPSCVVIVGNWFHGSRTWAMINAALLAHAWVGFLLLRRALLGWVRNEPRDPR